MNQTTPLAVDQYSRFMIDTFDQREIISVPTAFQAFFTNGFTNYSPDANIVDIDIIKGNEKLAALIHRGGEGRSVKGQKNTNEAKWTNVLRKYPLGEEEGDISADQLNFRIPGEHPYAAKMKLERMRVLAAKHHLEHIRRYGRLFEFLCSEALLKGTMPAILGTTVSDLIYDFYRLATHLITVSTKWDAASPDIFGDIDGACDLVRADGHITPDMMILGGSAMDAFIKDTTVSAVSDNRRYELIEVSLGNPVPEHFAKFVAGGLNARGRVRTPKGYELWMFTYNDLYTNASGVATKYMPESKALICNSKARCDRYFGPSEVLPPTAQKAAWYQEMFGFNMTAPPMPPIQGSSDIIRPEMFYSDAYQATNDKNVTIRTQSAPIFATTQTDAFVTLLGLV